MGGMEEGSGKVRIYRSSSLHPAKQSACTISYQIRQLHGGIGMGWVHIQKRNGSHIPAKQSKEVNSIFSCHI